MSVAGGSVRGEGGGGEWELAEEWSAHQKVQVLGEQQLRRHVCELVQASHPGFHHQ
jgi:hypothetical protein